MTLDAGIVGMDIVEAGSGLRMCRAHRMVNVRAARTVTPFAADIHSLTVLLAMS